MEVYVVLIIVVKMNAWLAGRGNGNNEHINYPRYICAWSSDKQVSSFFCYVGWACKLCSRREE